MIYASRGITISQPLKEQILICLKYYLSFAEKAFDRSFALPFIIICRKGSVAGTAHLKDWTIKLNAQLLLDYQSQFIHEVIPHELAHLLVYSLYGKVKPHGKEWQSIMKNIFCISVKRTHEFTNTQLQQTRFRYQCDCQMHYLSLIRHNRIQKQSTDYLCTRCKKKLQINQ